MPVTIDTLAKLRMADDILRSGRGTPEERAELQMAVEQARPAIDFATGWREKGSFNSGEFFSMSEQNQNIANDFLRQESRRQTADANAKMLGFAGGMGRGATELGTMAADLVGLDSAAAYLDAHGEQITDATQNLSLSIRERAYGRKLTDEEREAHVADIEGSMQAGEITEKIAVSIAGPGRILGMAKGFWSGLGLGTAEGAVSGALLADIEQGMTEEERMDRAIGGATIGMIFGAPIGAVTGAFASVRNLVARKVAQSREGAEEAFKLGDEFDVPLTLGQATGNPVIQSAEQQAAGATAQKFLADQAEKLIQAVPQKLGIVLPKIKDIGAELPETIRQSFNILDDVIKEVKKARQTMWRETGKKAVEVGGDSKIMQVDKLQESMQDIMEQIHTRFGGAAEMGSNFKTLHQEINQAATRGGATADQVSKWWLRINTMADAPTGSGFVSAANKVDDIMGPQLDALSGQLARAMRNSIDEAADSPAMALLKSQREVWSEGQKVIKILNDDVLKSIGLEGKVTGERLLRSLDAIADSKLRFAADYIKKQKGGALKIREIQAAIFESAAEAGLAASKGRPGQAGLFNVQAFSEALGATSARSRAAGFLTTEQELLAKQGMDLARTILNEGAQQSGRVLHRIVVGAENIAINLISRDPGFMARMLAGALARGRGADWLFYSKEGIEVLRSMTPQYLQFGKTAATRQAAIALVAGMLGDGAKEDVQDELDAQQRQQ